MSDNPRPALYGARYSALLANRADEPPAGRVRRLRQALRERRRPDRAGRAAGAAARATCSPSPATGAYTLAMASTYNAVPRPAAVLVGNAAGRP